MDSSQENVFVELLQLVWRVMLIFFRSFINLFVPKAQKNVQGQKILITGAASGLGRQLALRFAHLGCHLILWDRDKDGLLTTFNQIKEQTHLQVKTNVVDLSNRHEISKVSEEVLKEEGSIDILINCAGIVSGKKFLDTSEEAIERTFAVNSLALCWMTRAFLPAMLVKNSGHLVTIASSAGWIGVPGLADYCASKFAAVGFDESMRVELKKLSKNGNGSGVKTTCICPFFIDTGMFEGVKTRFPLLLPILKPDYAVDQMVDAILSDQEVLFLPHFPFWLSLFRGLFPVAAFDELCVFLGVSHSMDQFKGRTEKKNE